MTASSGAITEKTFSLGLPLRGVSSRLFVSRQVRWVFAPWRSLFSDNSRLVARRGPGRRVMDALRAAGGGLLREQGLGGRDERFGGSCVSLSSHVRGFWACPVRRCCTRRFHTAASRRVSSPARMSTTMKRCRTTPAIAMQRAINHRGRRHRAGRGTQPTAATRSTMMPPTQIMATA